MPINEFGAEVINGYVVIDSTWNTAKTARTIIAVHPTKWAGKTEFVTACAGMVGATSWYSGHYFSEFEKAVADYKSR